MNSLFFFGSLSRYFIGLSTAAIVIFTHITSMTSAVGASEINETDKETVSIRDSVISTLETNPRLAELKQNRTAVNKDLKQTQGRYYPKVDTTLGYGTDQHSDLSTRAQGTDNSFDERSEASIILVQPLYQGGEISNSVKVQTAKLESADYRVLDNAEALALDAVIAHLEVWRQRQLLDLTDQNVDSHRQILRHIQERQHAGAGSTADVMQANGRLSLTLSSRYQIEADVEAAGANYLRIVGYSPWPMELPNDFRSYLPATEDEVLSRVRRCNPKLAAFAADIRAAEHEIDVKRSSFLPKVNLEVSSSYNWQVEGSQSYDHNNAAMVRARWNLYNGGSDVAARDAASARKLQAKLARKNQYELIAEQVRDTRGRYRMAGEQIRAYTDAVKFNRQTRDAYQQQFVVGQRTLLDVLDAENELFQSSGQLITAKVNEMIASYRLLALMNCLIRSLNIDHEAFGLIGNSPDCCGRTEIIDSDADGVADTDDRCPTTPQGVVVDTVGCPIDGDGDGVPDYLDQCPGTPQGVKVDLKGCPIPKATKSAKVTTTGNWLYNDIQFETNKWNLKPSSYPVLDEIVFALEENTTLKVEIQGHTDSKGKRDYNLSLSLKRARSVRDYLIDKGISAERITAKGCGPDLPIDTNKTASGRTKNRRVELRPIR